MLKKAKAGHYAVGQFNINNLEWTKAILLTAQELNSPGLRHLREIKITINRRNAGFFMSNFIYFYVVRSCILSLYVI